MQQYRRCTNLVESIDIETLTYCAIAKSLILTGILAPLTREAFPEAAKNRDK